MSDTDSAPGGISLRVTSHARSESPAPRDSRASKRKRNHEEPQISSEKKVAKRKKAKKGKNQDDGDIDIEAGLNLAIRRMDPPLLADYVAQRTKRFEKDLSSIELEDKYISGMFSTELLQHSGLPYAEISSQSIRGHDGMAKSENAGRLTGLPRACLYFLGTGSLHGVCSEAKGKSAYYCRDWSRVTRC